MNKLLYKSNLSIVLLIGIVFQRMPLSFLQPFLGKAMHVMQDKHMSIFNRLKDMDADFLIDPTDLPFMFYMRPSKENPVLRAVKKSENIKVDATIRGSFTDLLLLFEGKLDGDAAFFSKQLIIEGSTAASVALRNAIDGENMNLVEDLSEIFKPFDKLFIVFANKAVKIYNSLQETVTTVSEASNYNSSNKIQELNTKIDDIYQELDEQWDIISKLSKEKIRRKSDYSN